MYQSQTQLILENTLTFKKIKYSIIRIQHVEVKRHVVFLFLRYLKRYNFYMIYLESVKQSFL